MTFAEQPRGIFRVHCDQRGRLRLPTSCCQFLVRIGEGRVFITSLELGQGRIYPLPVWRENEALFENLHDQTSSQIQFLANLNGAETNLDSNGRLELPSMVIEILGGSSGLLYLWSFRGCIRIFNQTIYEETKQRAIENLPAKVLLMESRGLR